MNQKEIIEDLSKELNLPQEKIKLVIESFWKTLRYYLTTPEESKGRIIIPYLGTFNLSKYAIINVINKLNNKEIKRTQTIRTIEFYNELLKIVETNERQARKEIINE